MHDLKLTFKSSHAPISASEMIDMLFCFAVGYFIVFAKLTQSFSGWRSVYADLIIYYMISETKTTVIVHCYIIIAAA